MGQCYGTAGVRTHARYVGVSCLQGAPEPNHEENGTDMAASEIMIPEDDEEDASSSKADREEDDNSSVKPPYSYAQLIVQALLASGDHRQTLSGIYSFISSKYSYYKLEDKGWKVS